MERPGIALIGTACALLLATAVPAENRPGEAREEEDVILLEDPPPPLDVTRVAVVEELSSELFDALPTARSYQDFLQLVAGTPPAAPGEFGDGGDPASRSGLNYRDLGGEIGVSRDNLYLVDGIDVTDPVTGTSGARLNPEIIATQEVLLGGLSAEYGGGAGLVSRVVTRGGTNRFAGSLSAYYRDDGLRSSDEHEPRRLPDEAHLDGFADHDAAFTLGGPVVRDRAWFFASWRRLERRDRVVGDMFSVFPSAAGRAVRRVEDQLFARFDFAPTPSDQLTAVYLGDPVESDGTLDLRRTTDLDLALERGGERHQLSYSRAWPAAVLEASWNDQRVERNDLAALREPANEITFVLPDDRAVGRLSVSPSFLGGAGRDALATRERESWQAAGTWFAGSSRGEHEIRAGAARMETASRRWERLVGGARYVSLDRRHLNEGVTAGDPGLFGSIAFYPSDPLHAAGLRAAIAAEPDAAALLAALDGDGDGFLSGAEMAAGIVFDSTAGNPHGQINYSRRLQTSAPAPRVSTEGASLHLQDDWRWGRWSLRAGLRAERWEHFASDGSSLHTFDWETAPRLGLAWDPRGDGRQRLTAFYGRYLDPPRADLTELAGTPGGAAFADQVYVLGRWLTYAEQGGARRRDEVFAPSARLPYTDEWQLGYAVDLGRGMSLEANLARRRTRRLLEDYALALYAGRADGTTAYPGPPDHPDSLFLGPGYFGFDRVPDIPYAIANLAGGERAWDGLEITFRRRFTGRWQALASYRYAEARGNSNSDSDLDFQGDVLFLDPRAPNAEGRQPGHAEHLVKLAASYRFAGGFQLGAVYRWNSGVAASRAFRASQRHLPCTVDQVACDTGDQPPFDFAGITSRWIAPNSVGAFEHPAYGTLDLRLAYLWRLGSRLELDLFLDLFNALDDQAAVQVQDLVAGRPGTRFQESLAFLPPRQLRLGARLRF